MRENMIYNADEYQFRKEILEKVLMVINKQNSVNKNKNLIFGDSLVEKIPSDFNIINNGIGGLTSGALLSLLDELVIKFNPQKVYLHVGTNDMGETVMASPREIATNVQKIFMILKRNLPNTKFYLISTLPCVDERDSMFTLGRGIRMNALHNKLNEEYLNYLEGMDIKFINLYQALINDDGSVKKEYYKDGLHLNKKGYIYLLDIYKKRIAKELK